MVDETVKRKSVLWMLQHEGTEGNPRSLTDQSAESYAATFDTNVLGTLLSMKHELQSDASAGRRSTFPLLTAEQVHQVLLSMLGEHAVEGFTKAAA